MDSSIHHCPWAPEGVDDGQEHEVIEIAGTVETLDGPPGEAVNAETGEVTPAGAPLPPLPESAYPAGAVELPAPEPVTPPTEETPS